MDNGVVDNTLIGLPFQIKSGMVDSTAENTVTSSIFGVYFPVKNEAPKRESDPLTHISVYLAAVLMTNPKHHLILHQPLIKKCPLAVDSSQGYP